MQKISKDEYERLLKEYLKEQGPNKGSSLVGSLAWWARQKREFDEKLKQEGKELSS
jgi:hypothetical protein